MSRKRFSSINRHHFRSAAEKEIACKIFKLDLVNQRTVLSHSIYSHRLL